MNPYARIKQSIRDGLEQGKTLKELEAQLSGTHYGERAWQFQRAQASVKSEGTTGTEKRG